MAAPHAIDTASAQNTVRHGQFDENRTRETLVGWITSLVCDGAGIANESWGMRNSIEKARSGAGKNTKVSAVNHTHMFATHTGAHTNAVEGLHMHPKQFLRKPSRAAIGFPVSTARLPRPSWATQSTAPPTPACRSPPMLPARCATQCSRRGHCGRLPDEGLPFLDGAPRHAMASIALRNGAHRRATAAFSSGSVLTARRPKINIKKKPPRKECNSLATLPKKLILVVRRPISDVKLIRTVKIK